MDIPKDHQPVVETINLTRTYKIGETEVTALREVNLKVSAGEFVSIKGRSGSGKTTLLNLIGGLDRPDGGTVLLQGRDISNLGEAEMVDLRRRTVSFVFQSFGLLPNYSAYEIVDFALRLNGMPRKLRHARTLECLKLVGLDERQDHRPDEMSGGQQQRLCIARAISIRPSLILADEPTGELDSRTGREILTLLRTIASLEQTAILVATHDPKVQDYTSTTYMLSDGNLQIMPEVNQP
jgi:ABC-type lipoprotein export system ATPase subunit